MRRFLFIALLGMLPVQARAQREITVPDDADGLPEVRPCIDHAGRGSLRTTGTLSVAERPPIQVATPRYLEIAQEGEDGTETIVSSGFWDAIYRFRFDERTSLFGTPKGHGITLTKSYHSLAPIRIADAVVFTAVRQGRDRMVGWDWVWRDTAGRPFLPITDWPDPSGQGNDWRPLTIHRFAKPVRYHNPPPSWPRWVPDRQAPERAPDLFAMRGKRAVVRYGLYLSDIPALFEAARAEPCWR
ncbi:hypothetical protein OF829_18005 [Sphingomonas sp. LB-2]|uniref:hypothetical protein n=1 Tax=Sphingomonas caeni TaxID=2984949 RepID=UPI0022304534|nr:hypothetical protein [Sphingomonas caeni]MCW3849137.1 hypothetical protein [Sphingomonas caeni]